MEEKSWPSLEEWVAADTELTRKINEGYDSVLSPEEQARKLLAYLVTQYSLPLSPMDVVEREWEDAGDSWYLPISMLEQIAQLRFAEPENNDPLYLVLNAAYLIHHKLVIDLSQELEDFLGDEELQGLGYRGEDVLEAELIPVKKSESWFDKGCAFFAKDVL
jgi:hypothetical protein